MAKHSSEKHVDNAAGNDSHADEAQPTELAPQRIFSHQPESAAELAAAKDFQGDDFVEYPTEAELEQVLSAQPKADELISLKPKRWSWLARLALLGVMAAVVVQTLLGLVDAWRDSPWLFGFYSLVLALVLAWVGKLCFGEWRKLKRLRQVEDTQQTGQRLLGSMQMGEARDFIYGICKQMPKGPEQDRLQTLLNPEQNDAEQLQLFDQVVLTERDKVGMKLVRRYAAESALLLAASPLAVLDMALILWRNQKMIQDIARCYGVELGYWSRIRLIRGILVNILYAGTTELATDLGTQLLSVEMSGKLSARLGQGLGGGLLTARLGYQAMALCRPLAFSSASKPKLSRIHKELLLELKDFSASVLARKTERNKDFTTKE
ncbi:TIGR01620 family protein [Shewanella algae]|uniref:TIGR01620 family protein n=1 Tax=Shewanella algae TaxID=38313 RepID=UPI003CC79F11